MPDEPEIVASSDATWTAVRQRIYELELEEDRHAAIYSANHPLLKQVRERLAAAQEVLAKLKEERADESLTANPTKMKLREELQKQSTSCWSTSGS